MSRKRCKIELCNGIVHAKGLCNKHYQLLRRNGIPQRIRNRNGGVAKHPNYRSFVAMKRRCYELRNNRFSKYGGRGIKVCDRWLEVDGFWNFVEDMGIKPSPKHSLDRINNNGDYSKENCRWATPHQQSANRRKNNKVVGVKWHKKAKKWMATLCVNNNHLYLGIYSDFNEAVKARKEAEAKYGIV